MDQSSKNSTLTDILTDLFVQIPGGTITLRDDRKKQVWETNVAPFELARYQVTQALYRLVTGKSPSAFTGEEHPVESVSWIDAVQFCNRLSQMAGLEPCYLIQEGEEVSVSLLDGADGYRLPTDAEWEYAARAGTREVRHGVIDEIAWYEGNSKESTRPVGQKVPNSWGLYDILGDVWEWCWDVYDPEVYGSYRIFRGGGWADPPRGCLASNRRRSHPTYQIDDLGFRIARALQN